MSQPDEIPQTATPEGTRWATPDTSVYDSRWAEMASAGQDPHGEVAFIERFAPRTVLDAGCGTGRVAIELARRGYDVVGTDIDSGMLDAARDKAPDLLWHQADLAALDLRTSDGDQHQFDVVALPGNVMIFVAPGSEAQVVAACARHVGAGGSLVAGFQLGRGLEVADYERHAAAAGLVAPARFAAWSGEEWVDGGDYVVSVHRRSSDAV